MVELLLLMSVMELQLGQVMHQLQLPLYQLLSETDVTFVVVDSCGNPAMTTASFIVEDTSDPVITTPASNINVGCNSESTLLNWVANHGNAVATDACSTTLNWGDDFEGEEFPYPDCTTTGTVVFDVTDECGFTTITSADYTITDNQAPTITTPASDAFSECDLDTSSNLVDWLAWLDDNGGARATDVCSSVNWSDNSDQPPEPGCNNPMTVTFTADDGCGNSVPTTARFIIRDTTDPTFVDLPEDASVDCGENAGTAFADFLANFAGATGTDTCTEANIRIIGSPVLLRPTTGCSRDTPVTMEVFDECNNVSPRETAIFTVTDNDAPVISPGASDESIECTSTLNNDYRAWITSNGGASATDGCTSVTRTNDGESAVAPDCSLSEEVVFIATDVCGLFAMTTATFSAVDTEGPTLTTPASDLTVQCNPDTHNVEYTNWLNSRAGARAVDACTAVVWDNDSEGLTGDICLLDETVTFTGCDLCSNCVETTAT